MKYYLLLYHSFFSFLALVEVLTLEAQICYSTLTITLNR